MLICPKCNNQVSDDAQFCDFCGVQFLPRDDAEIVTEAQATTVLTPEMQQYYYGAQNNNQPEVTGVTEQMPLNYQTNEQSSQFYESQPQANTPQVNNSQPQMNYPQGQFSSGMQYPQQNTMPVAQLKTNRSFLKAFLLSLITFGIYPLAMYCGITNDVNTVCTRYDGKKSLHYLVMLLLTPLTMGILALVWNHNICERMGNELNRRQISYDFGSKDFWLWGILGSLIFVGPFIFAHKFITASNKLNADFNIHG